MGWLGQQFSGTKKEYFESMVLDGFDAPTKALKYTVKGSTAYAVMDVPQRNQRFILVCLIRKDRDGSMMHKLMDESVGPCYYDCPISYLDLVKDFPPVNEYAQKYREDIRKHHEEKKKKRKAQKVLGETMIFGRKTKILEKREVQGQTIFLGKMARYKAGYILFGKSGNLVKQIRYYSPEQAWADV